MIMKQKLLLLLMTVAMSVYVHANIVRTTIDNIQYDIDMDSNSATVSGGSGVNIIIPKRIGYNDKFYTVYGIGREAFMSHKDLESVVLPNSIVAIGESAFAWCTSLVGVVIPKSMKTIQRSAFAHCTSLKSITLPVNITLQDGAFGSTGLTSIALPANATIGESAFANCTSLQSVEIPNNINSIGEGIFQDCTGLTSAKVDFPTTGKCTFKGCTNLETVTLTERVHKIENLAFYKCSALTSISFTENLESIGEQSFSLCTALTSFSIPDNVVSLGKWVFDGCSSLQSVVIGKGVEAVQEYAFSGCSALESMTVKGSPAFSFNFQSKSNFPNFSKLIIPDLTAWCAINFWREEHNPMYYAQHLYSDENTEITDLVIPDNVTSIGYYHFYNCQSIQSLVIPESVETIGSNAYGNCQNLVSVTIKGSPTIGGSCFEKCSKFSKLVIPDIGAWCKVTLNNTWNSPTYIAKHIYSDLETEITDLVIPEGVTAINPYVFNNCVGLSSVKLPNSISAIEDYTFASCTNLSQITLGSGIRSISKNAFTGCKNITKLVIPDVAAWCSIEGVNYLTTNKPYLYSDENTVMTDVVIPEGVETLGDYAFYLCRGFSSVTLPNSLKSIGYWAFRNCTDLFTLRLGNGINSIGTSAFDGCSKMKKIVIPDISVLFNISYADKSSNPVYIAGHIYSDETTEIKELVIPESVKSIGDYMFYKCAGLTSLVIPNSVESIGSYAFYQADGLKSVQVGNGLKSIGTNAFYKCYRINKVIVSDISNWCGITFNGTTSNPLYPGTGHLYKDEENEIIDLFIPYGVSVISNNAFAGTKHLKSVDLPESIMSMGSSVFPNSTSLTKVTIRRPDPIEIGPYVFNNYKATLYVPTGSKQAYSEAEVWKQFNLIEEFSDDNHSGAIIAGDADGNGTVDKADIAEILNYLMGEPSKKFNEVAADANGDYVVNIADIVYIVNRIISQKDNK